MPSQKLATMGAFGAMLVAAPAVEIGDGAGRGQLAVTFGRVLNLPS